MRLGLGGVAEELMGQENIHGEARKEKRGGETREGSAETISDFTDSVIQAYFPTPGFHSYIMSAMYGWLLISGHAENI